MPVASPCQPAKSDPLVSVAVKVTFAFCTKAVWFGNFVTAPLDDGKRREVYVFFDNTDKLQAPDNARELMQALDVAASAASIGAAA